MVADEAHAAEARVRKSQPRDLAQEDLSALASCHRRVLPHTASSRAGVRTLEALYGALAHDPRSRVIWMPGSPAPELGAFASGTVDLHAAESLVRRSLSLPMLARMSIETLRNPRHLLAMRAWRGLVPRQVGYVLTVGVCDEARAASPSARGGTLMAMLEDWFRSAGAGASWVDTEQRNTNALRMYAKLGYRPVSEAFGQVLLEKVLR